MKTAISLPDKLYEAAEIIAKKMGIPRSRLFARALEEFIRNHNNDQITEKLDSVYENTESEVIEGASIAGLESIRRLTVHDTW